MKLNILTIPNPTLRQKSKPVTKIDSKVKKFVRGLEQTLTQKRRPSGVGLSAPQVGKPWRIFTTQLPKGDISGREDLDLQKLVVRTFINPEITKASKKMTLGPNKKRPILEGCLSIPGIWGHVSRRQWINFRWQTLDGKWQEGKFAGFTARVLQHELDHLNGILFTDRAIKDKLPLYEESQAGKFRQIELS